MAIIPCNPDGGSGGGSGGVESFAGRKGAVMPQAGDYQAYIANYDTARVYVPGETVINGDMPYRARQVTEAGVFNILHWQLLVGYASVNAGGIVKLSSANPAMNSTAFAGSTGLASDAGHIHPVDTSRAPIHSPVFTGIPETPLAPQGTNTNQLASTGFVNRESLTLRDLIDERAKFTVGDVKQSFLSADHAGWYLLNGRAKTLLPVAQQAAATSIGIGTNLPDSKDRFVRGTPSGSTVGAIGGNNAIARNALPNDTLTVSVSAANTDHTHLIESLSVTSSKDNATEGLGNDRAITSNNANASRRTVASGNDFSVAAVGMDSFIAADQLNHDHAVTIPVHSTNSVSSTSAGYQHVHTASANLNGGVTQQPHIPSYINLNLFVYLGA